MNKLFIFSKVFYVYVTQLFTYYRYTNTDSWSLKVTSYYQA